METDTAHPATAKGCFGLIGLASVIGAGSVLALVVTVLVPPWLTVKCQRREVLYFSEVVEDYEKAFAGYHGLFASRDWQTETSRPTGPRHSGEVFDVTEYRIYWGLLTGEWILIVAVAGGVFLFWAYRLNVRLSAPSGKAEQCDAREGSAQSGLKSTSTRRSP